MYARTQSRSRFHVCALVTLAVALSGPALADVTNGLVLHYPFDTNEMGIVTDQSGRGHTGTVYGATWTVDPLRGGVYSFDGDDYISTPHAEDLNANTGFSVCAWINIAADYMDMYRGIVSKQSEGDWNAWRG